MRPCSSCGAENGKGGCCANTATIRSNGPTSDEARLDVQEAVAKLPEDERALIVLRYYEGLSYAQMAEVLDRPAGTIASGLNRARAMLKECLEP